ncbi:MAG: LysM peptidoglycan-binding domain-containing protein [PVC group bacterium]
MEKQYTATVFRHCLLTGLSALAVLGCGRDLPEEEPVFVPDHVGKAQVFYHQGNYTGAVEMYHKALEMDPDNADAYLQMGIIYDDNLKDKEQAVYYYHQFLEREPDSDKADRVRSWIEKIDRALALPAGNGRKEAPPPGAEAAAPVPGGSPPEPTAPALPGGTPPPETGRDAAAPPEAYTVQPGDNLARIAEKFYGDRTAWKQIYQANRQTLANPNALKVGQELTIPRRRDRAVIEM